jgi:hypothetical protein
MTSNSQIISHSFTPAAGNFTNFSIGPSKGHLDLTDYAEARGRAGYIVGNLLPYGFLPR